MKFDNQLRYAVHIIKQYTGDVPLAAWLKNFFSENRQMGSKDRKTVAELVYSFYRPGHALHDLPVEERILSGVFLSTSSPNDFLNYFRPQLNENVRKRLDEKIALLNKNLSNRFSVNDIFPWSDDLSRGVNDDSFSRSFLVQPDVFLRVRPGNEEQVRRKLLAANFNFSSPAPQSISLKQGIKVDDVLELDKEVVVQDYNSQQVGALFQPAFFDGEAGATKRIAATVWDCCAASGGKSIMAWDINPDIQLTVSDVRPSILHNLTKRFHRAGIKNYKHFIADLTDPNSISTLKIEEKSIDLIIADLPCSGSGTWSRTPEQLYFFRHEKISHYSNLQKKIVSQLFRYLKAGGSLVYITCSVFREENEEVVEYIRSEGKLKCVEMRLFAGYDMKADTLFGARFTL